MTTFDFSPRSTEHPFAGLEPQAAFEAAWPDIKVLRNRSAVLTGLIAVASTACVFWLAIEMGEAFVLLALFYPAFAVFWGNRTLQRKVTETMIPYLAAAVRLEYHADGSHPNGMDLPAGLLPRFNRTETRNSFTGVFGQSPFLSVEVTVKDKQGGESSSRQTQTTTYFAGLCVVVTNLPRADPLVVSKAGKTLFGDQILLSDRALRGQINELTGHQVKKAELDATQASDLELYIPKTSKGPSAATLDFLGRLAHVEGVLGKKDRLYSAVRTDHDAAISIQTNRSGFALGGLLMTRQKLLTQMEQALQDFVWPIRLVEALVECD